MRRISDAEAGGSASLLQDNRVENRMFANPKIMITTNPTDVEEMWRRAEREMLASPYQTFSWYSAWLATVGAQRNQEPIIVVAYDESDKPIAILPLIRRRTWLGLILCEFAGGRHSNANFGLFTPSFMNVIDKRSLRQILRETNSRARGIDAFCLVNMPTLWCEQNIWASKIGGQSSPSALHATAIVERFEEWRSARLSPSRTKKLRQKLRYLNRFGPTRLLEGSSPAEVERILTAFYTHKCQRFAQLGLHDPFVDASVRDFLRTAALRGADELYGPAIKLFALEANGEIVSTLGTAIIKETCSAMFLSFDGGAAARIASPGELLVTLVIELLCQRGFSQFDLGIGEAPYKDRYCAQVIALRDFFYGTTFSGTLIACVFCAWTEIKRNLKIRGYAHRMNVALTRLRHLLGYDRRRHRDLGAQTWRR